MRGINRRAHSAAVVAFLLTLLTTALTPVQSAPQTATPQDPAAVIGLWKGTASAGAQRNDVGIEIRQLANGVGFFLTLPPLHAWRMPVGLHPELLSHQPFVATRGRSVFARMQAGLHQVRRGFESSAGKPVWQCPAHPGRAVFLRCPAANAGGTTDS